MVRKFLTTNQRLEYNNCINISTEEENEKNINNVISSANAHSGGMFFFGLF